MKNFTTDDYMHVLKCRKDLKETIKAFREAPQSDDYSEYTDRIKYLTGVINDFEKAPESPSETFTVESGADVPVEYCLVPVESLRRLEELRGKLYEPFEREDSHTVVMYSFYELLETTQEIWGIANKRYETINKVKITLDK